MYSPVAIDIAPPTNAAIPAVNTGVRVEVAAATPITRLAVETMPSLAPTGAVALVVFLHVMGDGHGKAR
jgi:hypothetical protein